MMKKVMVFLEVLGVEMLEVTSKIANRATITSNGNKAMMINTTIRMALVLRSKQIIASDVYDGIVPN